MISNVETFQRFKLIFRMKMTSTDLI